MRRTANFFIAFFFGLVIFSPVSAEEPIPGEKPADPISGDERRASWESPGAELRPLQIIHGYFGVNKAKWSHPYLAFDHFKDRSIADGIRFLKNDCGLGGIVCNVSSFNYLTDEEEWGYFIDAVRAAKANGLRVWIYDEDRYPSLSAGGHVLAENPELEAKELVWDAARETFLVRPSFEYTHASNNFAYIRRYPSLVNPEACRAFIRWTHENYKKRLGPELFDYVEAFFTDEPSTNAMNTGLLSDNVRRWVRTTDAVDPEKPRLPMVAWEDDFPAVYQKIYGEDLIARRKSLFQGDAPDDLKTRRQFWSMVAHRSIDAYYGQIQKWCAENHKLSSGHTLWEGSWYYHPPLDGNKLAALKCLDIPGIDFLNTEPNACFYAWKDPMIAASAAWLTGRRKVMTEISDIGTYIGNKPHASLEKMCATAAWQSIFGVTEFTLYYQITDRTPEIYRKYCDYVGRLNAMVRDAEPVCDAVLLYPIGDIQEEYLPSDSKLELKKMSPRMQRICGSSDRLGKEMLAAHAPFMIAEESDMEPLLNGKIPGLLPPKSVVIPDGVHLADELKKTFDDFQKKGGNVFYNSFEGDSPLCPAEKTLLLGKYRRGAERIYLVLNTSEQNEYAGTLKIEGSEAQFFNPADGRIESARIQNETVEITLRPLETVIVSSR